MSAADPRQGLKVGTCSSAGTSYELVLGLAVHGGTAIAVGGQGRDLFRLSVDGTTFRNGVSPGPGLRGALLRADGLWVTGEYGYLARSLDRGRTWERLATKTKGCLFGVVADGAGRLWVAGDNGYLAMSSDGERFRRVKGVAESIARISDSPLGVLVPTDAPGYLYVCDGTSVERLGVSAGVDLMSATVTPTGSVITVGAVGTVYRSDGGRELKRVPVPTKELLTSVRCLPDGRVVAVGANGVVLVSGDDGRSFTALEQFAATGTLWCCEPYGDALLIGGEKGLIAWLGEHAPEAPPARPDVELQTGPTETVTKPVWAAPPRSTAVQDWRPPAPEPVELRDGVYVSAWLRGALYPRRGGIVTPIRPLPTVDEAWAALRRALWAADRHGMMANNARSGIWKCATNDDDRERRLGERILDPTPRAGTAEDDVALVSLTMKRYDSFLAAFDSEVYDRTADFLVASVGLTEALRRCLVGLDDELPYVGVGPFGRLRELLVLADEASYLQARTAILETRDAELKRDPTNLDRCADLRWAVAFLLPVGPVSGEVERAALQEAMRNVGRFGDDRVHACGIAAGDLATLRRFLEVNKEVKHQFFAPFSQDRMYLASVLELAGGAAAEVLATMKPADPWTKDPYHNGLWTQLLAHAAGDAALGALHRERRAGLTWGTAGLLLAASFDPDRVRRFALDQDDDDLARLVDTATRPEPPRAPDDDLVLGDLATPVPYTPPPALRGNRLDTPLAVEPDQHWRDEEVQRARDAQRHGYAVNWNGVSLDRCDPSEVDAFVAHRERWAVPTDLDLLTIAPPRVHDRLLALGFEIGGYDARRLLLAVMHQGGLTHLPLLLAALDDPASMEFALDAAQPFGDVSIVPAVAKAFAGKKHKVPARSWILRHPRHAAAGAVTLWTNARDDAGVARVLRYLDAQGHRATVLEFAAALGTEAPVRALLDEDPLAAPRAKQPVLPAFADPRRLPRLDDATDDETATLLVQLAHSNADEIHPGVLAARSRYSAASRAAFVWALFEAWLADGGQPSWAWCMQALGFLGDDDCARRLAALARKWPGVNASARAQAALDALLNIGTDTALININLLAEKSRFPAFAAAARERIDAIAYARGLTADELADRLVPTLGLDEEGADVVDTGTHKYRIVFDANLVPVLRDERGSLLTDLPKPGKADDKQRAKEAKASLSALRKDARASASLHLSRIERAMCTGRAIGAEVFLDRYARHPWMRHLAARLVWGLSTEPTVNFRVAEDGTLADLDENRYELPPAAVVVRHPLDLAPEELTGWSEVFADYEILQPFPQLARPVFRLADTPDPVAGLRGRTVTYGQLRGLEARGWERWHDACVQMGKRLGGERGRTWAVLETDPGWHASDTVDSVEPQRIEGLGFFDGDAGRLDARTYSELVYDLRQLG